MPESHSLTDDVSNDLIIGSPAPGKTLAKVSAQHSVFSPLFRALQELISTHPVIASSDPAALFSGNDILHLLSIQRK
jgi:hypothetical protein